MHYSSRTFWQIFSSLSLSRAHVCVCRHEIGLSFKARERERGIDVPLSVPFHLFSRGEITLLLIMSWWILWMMEPYIRHQQSSKFMHTHENEMKIPKNMWGSRTLSGMKNRAITKFNSINEKLNLKRRPNSNASMNLCYSRSLFNLHPKFLSVVANTLNEVIKCSLRIRRRAFYIVITLAKPFNDLFMFSLPILHARQVPASNRHICSRAFQRENQIRVFFWQMRGIKNESF